MRYLFGFLLLASGAFAAPYPKALQATTPENIPLTSSGVTDVYVSASTVVTVTVPYFSTGYIASGDPLWVCDNPYRCGPTFPASTVSVTGWVFNPQARNLISNLSVSTSQIWVYARPQDMVSGTATSQNIGAFEWFCQPCAQ